MGSSEIIRRLSDYEKYYDGDFRVLHLRVWYQYVAVARSEVKVPTGEETRCFAEETNLIVIHFINQLIIFIQIINKSKKIIHSSLFPLPNHYPIFILLNYRCMMVPIITQYNQNKQR